MDKYWKEWRANADGTYVYYVKDGDKMNWTALRQKEDGTTFTATFEMKKVE